MVVTMIPMGVVQMTVDQIVGMGAVRHRFMAATRAVVMTGRMPAAVVVGRARLGVGSADREDVLLNAARAHVVQMAVVQVINVAVVPHRLMPAVRAMLVRMAGMDRMTSTHELTSF
jgi:hypothetical protein